MDVSKNRKQNYKLAAKDNNKITIRSGDKPPKEVKDEVCKAADPTGSFDSDSPRFRKEEMWLMAQKAEKRHKK